MRSTAIYLPFPYFAVGLPPFSAFGYASLFNLFVALFIFRELFRAFMKLSG